MKLDIYSHHFVVHIENEGDKYICNRFAVGYTEYSYRVPGFKGQRKPTRVFAAATKNRKEFRFHIHCLDNFFNACRFAGLEKDKIEQTHYAMYVPPVVEYNLNPSLQPREMQPAVIDFIMAPGHIKQVPMQTGKGKTFTALYALAMLKVRMGIVVKKGFIHRWFSDLLGEESLLRLEPFELLVIRGLAHLSEVITMAVNGELDPRIKVIMVSTNIMDSYYDYYDENDGDMSAFANVPPDALWAVLGVGGRILDEVHMLLHMNFRMDMYTHMPKAIYLSATLIASNPLIDIVYKLMFPPECRANVGDYDKYINMTNLFYGTTSDKIKWTRFGSPDYSQAAYEESIMKQPKVLKAYVGWLTELTYRYFINLPDREDDQKACIFCGLIEMCTLVTETLNKEYPELDTRRFTSTDGYENVTDAQIIVTTHGSLGTAHDVPNLRVVIKAIGMGKQDANLQNAGRLRKLKKYPHITPEYYYLTNRNIPQHMKYHKVMEELFLPRVLKFRSYETSFKL